MADYTFTVRATDNVGAFSDRSFTISVNNTSVERFVALGTTGLAHSPTGLAGSWTTEAGITGAFVEFGGGKWAIWDDAGSFVRVSGDATNWSTMTPVWPSVTQDGVTVTYTSTPHTRMKYRKGQWVAFRTGTSTANTRYVFEFTSADLVSWTYTGRFIKQTGGASDMWTTDFEYDPQNDRWCVMVAQQLGKTIATRAGSGNWTSSTFIPTNNQNYPNGNIVLLNGLWVANPGFHPAAGVYISIDGVNFTLKTMGSSTSYQVGGLTYSNGRLIVASYGANTTSIFYTSINGGRNWTSSTSNGMHASQYFFYQPLASYGGVSLCCEYGLNLIDVSTDGSFTASSPGTSISLPAGVGLVFAVAARAS